MPFWHNANSEKMGIIDRYNYRQRKILMFYYKSGTGRVRIIGNVSYGVTIDSVTIDRGGLYVVR